METATLSCPSGYYIFVTSAWYGRLDTVTCMYCGGYGCCSCSTSCYLNSYSWVASVFNYYNTQSSAVGNSLTGSNL